MLNLQADVFDIFAKKWALLTAGDEKSFNTMTIGWGGLGTLWGKPVVTVYVKPIRYTYEFMEKNGFFTVSFFPEEYRKDLAVLGSKSGRDCDKIALTKLTPVKTENGMSFAEAELTLECKKIYAQDLDTKLMPPDVVERNYLIESAHRMFIGEVVNIIK